jgi:hypothetical protein
MHTIGRSRDDSANSETSPGRTPFECSIGPPNEEDEVGGTCGTNGGEEERV